jgi:hypothetical protein
MLRSCYSARFELGDGSHVQGQYYFSPNGSQWVNAPTYFSSGVWRPKENRFAALVGDVPRVDYSWYDGTPPIAPMHRTRAEVLGACKCPSPQLPLRTTDIQIAGVPRCCISGVS